MEKKGGGGGGGREDKTRGSYKPLPHLQVSLEQPDRSHKDSALMAEVLRHTHEPPTHCRAQAGLASETSTFENIFDVS